MRGGDEDDDDNDDDDDDTDTTFVWKEDTSWVSCVTEDSRDGLGPHMLENTINFISKNTFSARDEINNVAVTSLPARFWTKKGSILLFNV